MKYLFGENRFVYEKPADAPEGGLPATESADTKLKESKEDKEKRELAEKTAKGKDSATNAASIELERLRLSRQKLSPEDLKKAKEYFKSFKEEEVKSMLEKSGVASIYDLQRGGSLRLRYEKETDSKKKELLGKMLYENQGYAQMIAQFSKEKSTDDGRMYLEVDLKNVEKYEQGLGAGHICPHTWVKVSIEDKNGNIQTGYRKIPGVDKDIRGTKVGYYTAGGVYIVVYSGYKIYPLEIKDDSAQVEKEGKFYETDRTLVEKPADKLVEKPARPAAVSGSSSVGTSTSEAYESSKSALSGSDKSELAARGITPFTVRMGYELTPEERTIYDRERKEAYRIGRMGVDARLDIMQQRYKLRDAIELSFRALKMQEKHKAYFYAYNDALMRVESNYNPLCVNMTKGGKVALSTASGAYQILNSTWADLQKRLFGNTREAEARRKSYGKSVDFDLLKDVNFNASLPGEVTPYEQAIFHNIYVFNGSRVTSGTMAFDNVFDKLQSGELSPEMKYSYQAYMYTNWRNGLGGAKVFLQMMDRGIPFPQNEAQAREYFDQMPDCWQKRRGFGDFRTLVMACRAFVQRFDKNLQEMGAA